MYLRPGELEALDWRDIVPGKWIVTIQRSICHEQDGISKSPKAGVEYAAVLRKDLLTAGVTRTELHDLRTTRITWMAVRGDSVLAVMARAGHSDIKMTQHYVAEA